MRTLLKAATLAALIGVCAAAQAFVSGQNDAAMTYEPYLSTVRAAPDKGKIIATTRAAARPNEVRGCTVNVGSAPGFRRG